MMPCRRFAAIRMTFDLVITDMSMYHMTGLMLAEELLKIRPDIPIILFTGHNEMVDEKIAMEAGIKALITKPVKAHDLVGNIRDVLGHSVPEG